MELPEIKKQLEELPAKIEFEGVELVKSREKMENAKLNYEVVLAKEMITQEGTVLIKEANAKVNCQKEAEDYIKACTGYRFQEVKVRALSDKFDGIRKEATLIAAELGRLQY